VDGDAAVVGVDDFTQKAAGEVTYIEMPEEGDSVEAGDLAGSIETGKWVGKLYSPVSGEIAAVNQDVADDPSLINSDPYGDGWLFNVTMSDPSELESLMKVDAATDWLQEEIKKHIKK